MNKVPLTEFIPLQRGFDLPATQRKGGTIPVVASTAINGFHNEPKVSGPGVVIGRSGSIGGGQYLEEDFWPLNTTLWVKDFKEHYPRYVYYLLKSIDFSRFNAGSGVPTLNRNHLVSVMVSELGEGEEIRVADFLASYDDLIENNNRRIQLLEKFARLLYQEWFVHLRFPGHEHVDIVDGVPEGWLRKPLGDLIVLNYGKALKKDDRVPGEYPVYGSSGIVGSHEKALVEGSSIIVGRKGNVGSVFWSSKNFYPIDTVYFINNEESNFYLYYALQNIQFISTDVAVPGLNRNLAYSREVLVPEKSLVDDFVNQAELIRSQIEKLDEYNKKLTEARDLLLPRLMNGEISI